MRLPDFPKCVLIGSGGREHIIAKTLKEGKPSIHLTVIGPIRNPGIEVYADSYISGSSAVCGWEHTWVNFFYCSGCNSIKKDLDIDLVIIGPEAMLAKKGFVKNLIDSGIPVFGPKFDTAQIELNKGFCRKFVENIGFSNMQPKFKLVKIDFVSDVIDTHFPEEKGGYVIKKLGLAGGKGVRVYGEHLHSRQETIDFCDEISENEVLIEERLIGEEFSLMSFCDKFGCIHMPVVKDFKRAYSGNKGPNTGGMGCISYSDHSMPFLTKEELEQAQMLNEEVVKALEFKGVLYGGFMKTKSGIKLIEYNARFGDPECINVLSLLNQDDGPTLFEILWHCANETLKELSRPVAFDYRSVVVRYLAPNGYPDNPVDDSEIYLGKLSETQQRSLIYASVEHDNTGRLLTKGSRTLAVVGTGQDLSEAAEQVEQVIDLIHGPLFYRDDIPPKNSTKTVYQVNIDTANKLIDSIAPYVSSGSKGFGGIFSVSTEKSEASQFAMTTDGIGSKTDLVLDYLGIDGIPGLATDLVSHCINDLLCVNAHPIAFVDYIGTHTLDPEIAHLFIKSVSEVCQFYGISLVGGETAEMPDTFQPGKWDFTGTMFGSRTAGAFERPKKGNTVVALPSSGPHTNGYTLIRKLVAKTRAPKGIIEVLTNPHRCYLPEVLRLKNAGISLSGLVHITGGGLVDNPPRILGDNLTIKWNSELKLTGIWKWIQETSNLSLEEMKKIFNCGIGMLVFVNEQDSEKVLSLLEDSWIIGKIE